MTIGVSMYFNCTSLLSLLCFSNEYYLNLNLMV